jgi:hypothetical protein
VLSTLLKAAPRLEVRLLMPVTLNRWLALAEPETGGIRDMFEEQWRELRRIGAELERVTIVDEKLPSA